MIDLSQSRRRRRLVFAAMALVNLAGLGCGLTCTDIGCIEGLNVSFEGAFEEGRTYEAELTEVSDATSGKPLGSCTIDRHGTALELHCSSETARVQTWGHTVQLNDTTLKRVRVTVSTADVTLESQTFDVTYTGRELNGEGCGVCKNAQISVDLP